jgi:hypothetical protein
MRIRFNNLVKTMAICEAMAHNDLLSLILFLNLEIASDQDRMYNLDYFVRVTLAQSQQSSMELPKFNVILHSESGISKVNSTPLSLRLVM